MHLLFCCLAFASVAVSVGMAHNLYEDLYEDIYKILGIVRSATKVYMYIFSEVNAKHFFEHILHVIDNLTILLSATKYKIDWSDVQITPEDLFEACTELFPEGNVKRFSEHVFRVYDSDNSGRVDIKEVHQVFKIFLYAMPEQKLGWVFQLYDVNGDGTVERSETTEIIEAIYDMWGPWLTILDPSDPLEGKTRDIFAEMDENNDGILSKDEFFFGSLDDEFISQILNTNFSEWSNADQRHKYQPY